MTEKHQDWRNHEFVAYDKTGKAVVMSIASMSGFRSLDEFAAHYPQYDVSEVRNNREVRSIAAAIGEAP